MPEPQKLNIGVAELEPKAHGEPLSVSSQDMDYLKQEYHFLDDKDVSRLIRKSPDLVPALLQALAPIREIFGQDTVVNLFISYDPEGDCEGILFGKIQSYHPFSESMALLDRFDEEWWMRQPAAQESPLVFDMDILA